MADLTFYERNLPHWLPVGATIFLTFRLAGTLPADVLAACHHEWSEADARAGRVEGSYARQRRYFGRFDALLAGCAGPTWLREPAIAALVQTAMHYHEQRCAYLLNGYCIMPNHVHALVTLPDNAPPLARTLQSIKSFSAKRANKVLGLSGPFWHRETYDHLCRDAAEADRIRHYILANPVKAGLVEEWQYWPYSYWQPG